ncbi:unnamed protein product [Effrenium voratum]|nr:unnamed protein product [Effrenium voratum]
MISDRSLVALLSALLFIACLPLHTSAIVYSKESRTETGARLGIDWDSQNQLPPWLTSITEGADQAIAVVLGQSLRPDGSKPQVLLDRASAAKRLLDAGQIVKVVVSGGDPAGVGHTEASQMAQALIDAGIPAERIIQESQATTTAENAWFLLRWIPKGTGKLFIITSDFHMARASFIFEAVFNHFYKMMEDTYRDDPRWTSEEKRYPRLELVQNPTSSFCGGDGQLNRDHDPKADVNEFSLAKRARDELKFLGSGEVTRALYGEPLSKIMYIWPIQINITENPDNIQHFRNAMAQAMNAADALCKCKSPPAPSTPELPYPLALPVPKVRKAATRWQDICVEHLV